MTYSKISRDYLISEGFSKDRIIKIGSPMLEVINQNQEKINFQSPLQEPEFIFALGESESQGTLEKQTDRKGTCTTTHILSISSLFHSNQSLTHH